MPASSNDPRDSVYASVVASLDLAYDEKDRTKYDLRITATVLNRSQNEITVNAVILMDRSQEHAIAFTEGMLRTKSGRRLPYEQPGAHIPFGAAIASHDSLTLEMWVPDEALLNHICKPDSLFVVRFDAKEASYQAPEVCDHRFLTWPDYHPSRVSTLANKNRIEKKHQVFVSSTFSDLQFERQHAAATLLKADCIPCGMELSQAYIDNPELTARRFIEDCDFFLIIAGYNYGTVDSAHYSYRASDPDDLSYIELEYNFAQALKKPIVAFIQRNPDLGAIYNPSDESDRMWKFRERLKHSTYYYWLSPSDLGAKIELAVKDLAAANPLGGWVRSPESLPSPRDALPADLTPTSNKRVFVVHGRDEAARESVARFIEKMGLEAVILLEQPNRGYTIVEKFEQYSDVGYAVVLLTGDDQGGLKGKPAKQQSLRARQNVIFELGFFLGRIHRQRVCALYQHGVEIPSDFTGIVYIELDANRGWQLALATELKAAGFDINFNNVVK